MRVIVANYRILRVSHLGSWYRMICSIYIFFKCWQYLNYRVFALRLYGTMVLLFNRSRMIKWREALELMIYHNSYWMICDRRWWCSDNIWIVGEFKLILCIFSLTYAQYIQNATTDLSCSCKEKFLRSPYPSVVILKFEVCDDDEIN